MKAAASSEPADDTVGGTGTYRVVLDLFSGEGSRLRSDAISRERAEGIKAELIRRITIIQHEYAGGKGNCRE